MYVYVYVCMYVCMHACMHTHTHTHTQTDTRLGQGVKDGEAAKFQCYDGIGHRNLFALPKWVREGLARETRVMCKATPVFLT